MTKSKKNGLMSYEELRKLLQMTALQTSKLTLSRSKHAKEWRKELKESRAEHDREMKEIRALLRKLTPAKVRAFRERLRIARARCL